MKKIIDVLIVSSVLYSSLAAGGSAIYFGFQGRYNMPRIENTTSGQVIKINVDLSKAGGSATVSGMPECNGQYGIAYYTAYFHRVGIPDRIQVGSKWADVEVDAPGFVREVNSPDSYTYFYWNEENGGAGFWYNGSSCWNVGEVVNVNQFAPGFPSRVVTLTIKIPADLPDGISEMRIPVKYGKNVNFLRDIWDWNNHRKDLMSLNTTIASPSTKDTYLLYSTEIRNHARCSFDKPSYEINHKDVSLNDALVNNIIAGVNVNLSCTAPTEVEIKLSTDKFSNYNHNNNFSVNLGNGWDSLISLDGNPYDINNHEYMSVSQTGRKIKIESKLYGEAPRVTPGAINGSLVMTFNFK
ncbi:PapG chaperone-binding domain-containing protein [Escherichia coli]|uniref:PapG chaperone-binding domain-containing protein n=1 Tax=Escherichia coli TaxID=562 RepID=UPI000BE2126D|nr:PapG chaperone-binding domain-containing protein [Escherichia coli]